MILLFFIYIRMYDTSPDKKNPIMLETQTFWLNFLSFYEIKLIEGLEGHVFW